MNAIRPGRARSGVALAVTVALGLPLTGCLSPERRVQERELQRARAVLGSGYGADEPVDRIARRPAEQEDAEGALAAGPPLELVREAAVRRNPSLRAALERWVAFIERVPQKTALPYPSFRFGYSSMLRMYMYEGMQEVPFPAKLLAEGRAALAEARSVGEEFRERENALREQATSAYASLYLSRRELAVLDENLALLDRLVEIARAKYQAGATTQPDVLRAEIERETLRVYRAALARAIDVARSALNVLLDRPPEAPIGPLPPLPEPVAPTAGAGLLERALEVRPEVAAARERAAAADAMLSRARQEWIPDLAFGFAYVRDLGMGKGEVELTGGITLPVWWGRIGAGIAEAEAEVRRARAELRSTRNRVLQEVASASALVGAAADRWRILAHEAVPRAEQNVKASEAAYVAGRIDLLALIDSQRMLLAQLLERERALADYTMRRAELERAIGGPEGR